MVLFGIFLVPVPLGDPAHVAPPGGTVLRTPAVMLAVGGCGKGDNRISQREEQQVAGGVFRPVNRIGAVHGGRELFQQIHKVHPVAPASGDQQGGPPDDGQRQEPYPPGIFFCSYPAEEAPTLSSQQKDKIMQTVLSVTPLHFQ